MKKVQLYCLFREIWCFQLVFTMAKANDSAKDKEVDPLGCGCRGEKKESKLLLGETVLALLRSQGNLLILML